MFCLVRSLHPHERAVTTAVVALILSQDTIGFTAGGVIDVVSQARGVVDEFLALYETHVLNPLVELDKDIRGSAAAVAGRGGVEEDRVQLRSDMDSEGARRDAASCNDPLEMVRQMGAEEYKRWSPAARSRALAWLCDEALSAATMNDLVRKVQEAREVVDRKDREVRTWGGGARYLERTRQSRWRDLQAGTGGKGEGSDFERGMRRIGIGPGSDRLRPPVYKVSRVGFSR